MLDNTRQGQGIVICRNYIYSICRNKVNISVNTNRFCIVLSTYNIRFSSVVGNNNCEPNMEWNTHRFMIIYFTYFWDWELEEYWQRSSICIDMSVLEGPFYLIFSTNLLVEEHPFCMSLADRIREIQPSLRHPHSSGNQDWHRWSCWII